MNGTVSVLKLNTVFVVFDVNPGADKVLETFTFPTFAVVAKTFVVVNAFAEYKFPSPL
jgi:hypothetical protein